MSKDSRVAGSQDFTLGYEPGKGTFRVYVCLGLAAAFGYGWYAFGSEISLLLAAFFAITGYYFYPLIETGRVRIGAGEHGIFIEGLGVIPWRSIKDIRLNTYAVRSIEVNELDIELSHALPKALIADWRSLPYHRLLMKLPWSMTRDGVVRINLEPFPEAPDDIVNALIRTRKFFGNQVFR
ncbi:MAG: hypothetical protein ACR2PA_19025 [Hyphomicrobiaceae bacterium]